MEDSSAASIRSSSSRTASKKGSRMVRVDYSDKNGGPQAIRDENDDNTNQGRWFECCFYECCCLVEECCTNLSGLHNEVVEIVLWVNWTGTENVAK